MLADVLRLASSSASSSRGLVVEASSRVQGDQSTSSDGGPGSSSSAPGRRSRGDFPGRSLPLGQLTRAALRVVKVKRKRVLKRRNTPRSRCENFIPWVPVDADVPQDLEEEERMERTAGLLDRYAARKSK